MEAFQKKFTVVEYPASVYAGRLLNAHPIQFFDQITLCYKQSSR